MTDKFVASNGVEIGVGEEGHIIIPPITAGLGELTRQALREFFQAERDRELGRWRWPENPNVVVYPSDDGKHLEIIDEKFSARGTYSFGEANSVPSCVEDAGEAYFAVHPEPKPEWHDAKPGEVWAIVTENVADEVAVQRTPNGLWQFCDGVVRDDEFPIFSARRIWPVSDV